MDSPFELLTTLGASAVGALLAVLLIGGPLWAILPAVAGVGLVAALLSRRDG